LRYALVGQRQELPGKADKQFAFDAVDPAGFALLSPFLNPPRDTCAGTRIFLRPRPRAMAKKEKAAPAPAADGAEGEGAPAKKKLAGKQLILFIVLPAVLLLGGGGAAAYFLVFAKKPPAAEGAEHASKDGHGDEKKKDEKKKDDKKKDKKGDKGGEKKDGEGGMKMAEGPNGEAFLTLPDILVNVATADSRPAFLKLRLTLQVKDAETAEAISPALPRILDQYTGFLREMRMEDVAGSAGYTRLQLELLKRVNLAVAPAQVDAVLVEEMLVN
jgi:flagellar protein FliL